MNRPDPPLDADAFARLREEAAASGTASMLGSLAASLASRGRWHALFDTRLLEARHALGLPLTGDLASLELPPEVRERLDEASLAACREVGWPLLDEGQIGAAWMYLRAAVAPAELAPRLAARAETLLGGTTDADATSADDEETSQQLQELVGVALWEGVDPAVGLTVVLRTQGTCNAITAYEQAVARLPARRQAAAAAVLVAHLHGEIARAGGFSGTAGIHVDVSHLQSVLRIARVCSDEPTLRQAHALADHACRIPPDFVYPGEPPFESVGEASRHWYAAQLGIDVEPALAYFRARMLASDPGVAGTLPTDALVVLLARVGRPGEALRVALERPRDDGMPSVMQATGMLPSLIDLAAASGGWDLLQQACIDRGDEITFAAALAMQARDTGG
jgi:hypothetical protein